MRGGPFIRRLGLALIACAIALGAGGASAAPADFRYEGVATFSPFSSFGDLNRDGLLDVAGDGDTAETLSSVVYRLHSPRGVLGERMIVLGKPDPGVDPTVILADVVGDPAPEIVLLLFDQRSIVYTRPFAANRSWESAATGLPPGGAGVWNGDVTGDGRLDAILATTTGILVARNDGSGSPSIQMSAPLPGLQDSPLDFADVDPDRDGVQDIVVANSGGIRYLEAAGGGLTGWAELPGLSLGDVSRFAVGRFNADAAPDVVAVRGPFDEPRFSLLLSQSTGGLTTYREVAPPSTPRGTPCGVDTGELNGDGNVDIVLLGCAGAEEGIPLDGRVITLLGDGTGGFGNMSVVAWSGRNNPGPGEVEIIDLDSDGLGDVLVHEGDSATVIYMNHSVVVRPPPPPRPPPPAPPPGCRPPADCTAPKAKVKVAGKRWSIRKPLVVSVRCNERCTATVSVQLLFSRRGRVVRSIPVRERPRLALRPPRHATVKFLLKPKWRRTPTALLRRGLAASARISVRVVDPSGNGSTVTRTVRLTL